MSFLTNNNKRALIFVMIALSLIVLTFSYYYYKRENSFKDPRVKHARELYKKYNDLAVQNDFENVFALLDSVETIYKKTKHFAESFEVGVLYNNRAAAYLTMAIYGNTPPSLKFKKDSLLSLAQESVLRSISIYQKWLEKYDNKNEIQLEKIIKDDYFIGLEKYSDTRKKHFLKNRLKEIETAQYETKRRLSVSYTNLGIIYRHKEQYKLAIIYYQKALELWDRNLTAENNLNILLGKPVKKRNLIQKLFPPDRKSD